MYLVHLMKCNGLVIIHVEEDMYQNYKYFYK